jgi:predicted phage terminase large subunit-like protein
VSARIDAHLSKQQILDTLARVDARLASMRLRDFQEQAWHVVEPGVGDPDSLGRTWPQHGWHIDVICDHLEAVSRREIRRLIINMPPRCSKSLTVSVFWPVWTWIQRPETRFVYASYSAALSVRDSVKCRRLIDSEWFQRNWGDAFALTSDQNEKSRFENNRTGFRQATSVGGIGAGEGGDFLVFDDPHKTMEVESDIVRQGVIEWYANVLATRMNDPRIGCIVGVMQRLHHKDLSGYLLDTGEWTHLNLPMRYEAKCVVEVKHRCSQPTGSGPTPVELPPTEIGYKDPRKQQGELLWPQRFGERETRALEKELGEFGTAGQLQQRPTPREGGLFKPDRLVVEQAVPQNDPIVELVRYWDKAGTEGGGKYTAGVLLGRSRGGRFWVLDVVRGQWATETREANLLQTAKIDGILVPIWIEQEPGSAGIDSVKASIRGLSGFSARADAPTGDKVVRAEPFASQVNIGNVSALRRAWTAEYIEELRRFPNGTYADQVDASSGAFNKLRKASTVTITEL